VTTAPDPYQAAEPPSQAGFSVTAMPLVRPVVLDQFWADLTFVHWPVRPDSVAHLFPHGTRGPAQEYSRYWIAGGEAKMPRPAGSRNPQ
jgi:hypothetical protein